MNVSFASVATKRDFDFLIGKWRIRHHTLRERLAGCADWDEAGAIDIVRPAFAGLGNIGQFSRLIDGELSCGAPIRLFDSSIGQWRIWWLDTVGNRMEPPLYGGFDGNFGRFEGDDQLRGKPIRVRFDWLVASTDEATWKQSFSSDGGESWELNSIMEFTRDESIPGPITHPKQLEPYL